MAHWDSPHNVEQDQAGDGDLPTYEDLAEQHGPNSRFGRWRSWIEKRAAERYNDITPEQRARRRQRGWEPPVPPAPQETPSASVPLILDDPATPTRNSVLQIQTSFDQEPPVYHYDPPTPTPPAFVGEQLFPSHLRLYHFGSRFLPHTSAPIHALLPLPSERLVLIGHEEGMSVLDMFPHEWTEDGLTQKDPSEAQSLVMWRGEGVYQMSLLEMDNASVEGTPSGVVLMLVGSDESSPKDAEAVRALRMYNLASLVSLAKWTISQKGARPVDMRRPSNWHPQQSPSRHKKHKSHGSITRGIKNLVVESPLAERSPPVPQKDAQNFPRPTSSSGDDAHLRPLTDRNNSNSSESSWDLVDDLPLRWASDYVPLASPGSRLASLSVLFYDLKTDQSRQRGGALLAIASKSNILLYETPKGERAFRFVKDFYTPLTPRSITFVDHTVQDGMSRSVSNMSTVSTRTTGSRAPLMGSGHDRQGSEATLRHLTDAYGPQPSLFVIFEKKAGLIRISDSAVGEVELYDDGSNALSRLTPSASLSSLARRSRASFDGGHGHGPFGFGKEQKGTWLPPAHIELPGSPIYHHASTLSSTTPVCCLTRGKQTHIVPSPLPPNLASVPPLAALSWNCTPSYVSPRIIECFSPDGGKQPQLQLVAFGEDGVEVQELTLSFLITARQGGKGKAKAEEVVRADADVGGDVGFLCAGGHWHRSSSQLTRTFSTASGVSATSFDSLDSDAIADKISQEQGIYGWVRKGYDDYRVFWVGGTGSNPSLEETD